MTPENFAYWLMGHFELQDKPSSLNTEQTAVIRNHLNLVFAHIDLEAPQDLQETLNDIHEGTSVEIVPQEIKLTYNTPLKNDGRRRC